MKSQKSKLIFLISCVALTIIACMLYSRDESMSVASTPGVVNVTTSLNVRTGPGLDYDILTSSDVSISLKAGTQVSVLAVNGEWYHISFKYGTKTLKGYVLARYIKINATTISEEIEAKVTAEALNVRRRAGITEDILQLKNKNIRLSKGKKVYISSEKMVSGEKWYYISFTYNKKACKGYVLSTYVKLVLDESVSATIRSTEKVKVRTDAGTGATILTQGGKAVTLSDTKGVNIIKETSKNGKKWFKIKFQYGAKTLKGYVPANKVRYGLVKEEASSAPTVTAAPKESAAPAASSEPEETEEPKTATESEASGTSSPAVTKPLTAKQFKKHLKTENFPDSYKAALTALHEKYPYWQFNAYHTGLDWNTVIAKESEVGLNLISNSKSNGWKSFASGAYDYLTDSFVPYDGSTWVTASEAAVCYYMDPRNFLDARGIFQFESLQYQSDYQTKSGVEQILYNTPMYKTKYSYEEDGKTKYLLYSKTFVKAAKQSGVSPYHLASRAKQEVVTSSTTMSTSVSGTVSGYEGIYNFYNIGATHSTAAGGAVRNGLSFAGSGTSYMRPWTDRKKAIIGGAVYIGENYITKGQNTLYLQKFNVTSTSTYSHQYMANIEAPNSEATKTNTAYGSSKENMPIVFSIPVYENMPADACDVPGSVQNPNNYLKSLIISNGLLEPAFTLGDDGSKTYKASVDNNVTNILISATAVSDTASVSGDGSKSLNVGANTFTVKVTAQNGSVRKYKLQITRKEADAASASSKTKSQSDSTNSQKADVKAEEAAEAVKQEEE